MTENNTDMKHGNTCNCMGCQWNQMRMHHMGYRIARKVFIVFMLAVAFWFGARFGEMRAWEYQIGSQGRMMMDRSAGTIQPMMYANPGAIQTIR